MTQPLVANVGLKYRNADDELRRVVAGDRCDDVPEESLPWLLKQDLVAPVVQVDLDSMNADEAIAAVKSAPIESLGALEEQENARAKPRVTVLRAIAARRD